ncbi:hypothetical protein HY312_04540, partial [Candidatus Saccharibacteria bacterium]|nr:hypothetical protein [Candidatus Saccharibacteria bacterium]
ANKNRRIAHMAFMAFIDDFANIPPDEYRRIREESYNSMRTYNEDPDRAWQFTLTCMQLLQLTYVSDNYRQAQLATNAILSELGIDQSRLGLE